MIEFLTTLNYLQRNYHSLTIFSWLCLIPLVAFLVSIAEQARSATQL